MRPYTRSDELIEKGSLVTVVFPDAETSFEVSAAEESQLLESIAECERGETVTAEQLFARRASGLDVGFVL